MSKISGKNEIYRELTVKHKDDVICYVVAAVVLCR